MFSGLRGFPWEIYIFLNHCFTTHGVSFSLGAFRNFYLIFSEVWLWCIQKWFSLNLLYLVFTDLPVSARTSTRIFLSYWDSNDANTRLLILSYKSLRLCSFFHFFLFLRLQYLHSAIFKFIDSFLCHFQSATEPIK